MTADKAAVIQARFGVAINCIDGRAQGPVSEWLKRNYRLDYVDVVTLPGPDCALALGELEALKAVRAAVEVSVRRHGSQVVAVAGHHDCAGNPVSQAEHIRHIATAVEKLCSWDLAVTVIGLWVNDRWEVEKVSD